MRALVHLLWLTMLLPLGCSGRIIGEFPDALEDFVEHDGSADLPSDDVISDHVDLASDHTNELQSDVVEMTDVFDTRDTAEPDVAVDTSDMVISPPPEPLSVLFVGNSFTRGGPVPDIFADLAIDAGWPAPDVDYSAIDETSDLSRIDTLLS